MFRGDPIQQERAAQHSRSAESSKNRRVSCRSDFFRFIQDFMFVEYCNRFKQTQQTHTVAPQIRVINQTIKIAIAKITSDHFFTSLLPVYRTAPVACYTRALRAARCSCAATGERRCSSCRPHAYQNLSMRPKGASSAESPVGLVGTPYLARFFASYAVRFLVSGAPLHPSGERFMCSDAR